MRRLLFSPNTNKGVSHRHLHDLWDTPFGCGIRLRILVNNPVVQIG